MQVFFTLHHDFPLLRVTSQIMTPITKRTIKTPTQTPALKIPPTTAQLVKRNIIKINKQG